MFKKEDKIGPILLVLIGIGLSIRFALKFYTFHFIIPIPYKLVPGITVGNMMLNTSLGYGLIGFIIGTILLIRIFNEKKKLLKLGLLGFGLGIFINVLFYITNPWYTLQTHPRLFFYQDGKNITNKEIYFFLTERYGFDSTLYKPFKTLDDSITGLEFAKRIKNPYLYDFVFKDTKKYGYKNLIKDYKDDSFHLYFLNYILFNSTYYNGKINDLDENISYINDLISLTDNKEIMELGQELLKELNYASKLDKNEMKIEIDNYFKVYLDKIFGTKTIDKSIFL